MNIIKQSKESLKQSLRSKKLVLYGARGMTMRALNVLDIKDKVKYIVDENPIKYDKKLYGFTIYPVEQLRNEEEDSLVVLVCTFGEEEKSAKTITALGSFDIYFARILLNPIFEDVADKLANNQDKLQQVSALLYDNLSRYIFNEVTRRRMLFGEADFSDLKATDHVEYLLPDMFAESAPCNEVILDCGAYNGDTMELFIKELGPSISSLYMFEPNKPMYDELMARMTKLAAFYPNINFNAYSSGLSDKSASISFKQSSFAPGAFFVDERPFALQEHYRGSTELLKVQRLDDIFIQQRITFIKMDIEGSEYKALIGAEKIIKTYSPKLAISIYHRGEDYYQIPLLIKNMNPAYKLAVRHYANSHIDTDMYAWI